MKIFVIVACSLWCWAMGYTTGFRNADDVEFRRGLKIIKERLKRILKG